eukprot:6202398-Pleurochrysis_carterae.AAC.2
MMILETECDVDLGAVPFEYATMEVGSYCVVPKVASVAGANTIRIWSKWTRPGTAQLPRRLVAEKQLVRCGGARSHDDRQWRLTAAHSHTQAHPTHAHTRDPK